MNTNDVDAASQQSTKRTRRNSVARPRGRVQGIVFALAVVSVGLYGGGCGDIGIGGYKHEDLRRSRYKPLIQKQAARLAESKDPEDWRTAAKYYGSIGMLDEMDMCVGRYVNEEPEIGLSLIHVAQEINKFHGRKLK